jgi:cytoskeletal protein CcmA (bactofilin family)
MFGNKSDKTSPATSAPLSPNSSNSIVEGTFVEGNIKAPNDIRIDGVLIGDLNCSGRVIIGPQGKIEGNVTCSNAIIEGAFTGTISVSELLTVKDTGVINGDITTDKLMVQTGAVFNVTCIMNGQKLREIKGIGVPSSKE